MLGLFIFTSTSLIMRTFIISKESLKTVDNSWNNESKKKFNSSKNIYIVGIAGGSGSGKTTIAKAIYDKIGENNITYITHDNYYRDLSHLSIEERDFINFDHPSSLETTLLVQHLRSLLNNQSVEIPQYDFNSHTRFLSSINCQPRPIVLVEGILIFECEELSKLMDLKVYVDTAADERLFRRIQRDSLERGRDFLGVAKQYFTTVRPMHKQFVEPSKGNADIIIPNGLNDAALDLVITKLMKIVSMKD